MPDRTVLIIEDDATLLRGLQDNFRSHGYQVIAAANGQQGLQSALDRAPDLIILDIMLPKVNGFEICRRLRAMKIEAPIIMLTARDEESDVVLGLNLGADDYVTKPFSVKELMARVGAALRRRETPKKFAFGDFELDVAARTLKRKGREIKLTAKEFDLLQLFLSRPDEVLGRDDILNKVWGYGCFVTPRSIDRFVTVLRQKIEPKPAAPAFIQTVHGVGYKFHPPK
jgi:two-component system response regulator VicR